MSSRVGRRLIACSGRTLHVRLWPGPVDRTVVVAHGITGTSLDHLELADALGQAGWQVIAPDSLGCGRSDWATEPAREYGLRSLAELTASMLEQLEVRRTYWIGASKGGGLGITLAAARPELIAGLVLCDVGPELPDAFREALARRLAAPPTFSDNAALRAHVVRLVERAGLALGDLAIDRLTVAWSRRIGAGEVGYHYDPALSAQLLHRPEDFDQWEQWAAIACRTLILRGERSDVLTRDEAGRMERANPRARVHELVGSGHLNFLDDPALHATLLAWLSEEPA